MENVSSVLCQEKIIEKQDRASLPKIEGEEFLPMLTMLLGISELPGKDIAQMDLTGDESGNRMENNVEKAFVNNLLPLFNVECQEMLQIESKEPVVKSKDELLNIEESNFNEKGTVFTKEILRNEIPILDQEYLVENFKPEKAWSYQNLGSEEFSVKQDNLEFIVSKGEQKGLATESVLNSVHMAKDLVQEAKTEMTTPNNSKTNLIGHSGVLLEVKQTDNLVEDGIVQPNNDLLTPEEFLPHAFQNKSIENMEVSEKDFTIKAENLPKDIPETVMSKLKLLDRKDGNKEIVIHLEPKELGKLVVKLTSQEGVVSVKFMANYPVTRDLLESGLNNLRQSFIEQGINFDRLDVDLGGQQLNQSQHQHQQQFTWSQDKPSMEGYGKSDFGDYQEMMAGEEEPHVRVKTGTYDYLI